MGARDVLIPNLDCLSAELWRLGREETVAPAPLPRCLPPPTLQCLVGTEVGGLPMDLSQPWGHLHGQLGTTQPRRGAAPSPPFWTAKSTGGAGLWAWGVVRNLGQGWQTQLCPRVRVLW